MKTKRWFVFVAVVCSVQYLVAQNLVPNPSFEDTVGCPNNVNQVYNCLHWSSFGNSSDYFNACDSFPAGVPNNVLGFQQAATGKAYCGLYNFVPNSSYREYIGAQLINPLQIGIKYFASFKISQSSYWRCKSNKTGILFSTAPYIESNPPPLNNYAHIFSQSLIIDTANWQTVTGSLIADSNYQYIIIGNFFDNPHTDTIDCFNGTIASYLYIEDACVSTDSLSCNSDITAGITKPNNNSSIEIYPNPAKDYLIIEGNESISIAEIKIYDLYSELLEFNLEMVSNDRYVLKFNHSGKGIYFLSMIYRNEKHLTKKILLTN